MPSVSTEALIALVLAGLSFLGSSGFALWFWNETVKVRDTVIKSVGTLESHKQRMDTIERTCDSCRGQVKTELKNGEERFDEHETLVNNTKTDLLRSMNRVSEMNAEIRQQFMRELVAEANLRGKVLEIMINSCANFKKGGNSQ